METFHWPGNSATNGVNLRGGYQFYVANSRRGECFGKAVPFNDTSCAEITHFSFNTVYAKPQLNERKKEAHFFEHFSLIGRPQH